MGASLPLTNLSSRFIRHQMKQSRRLLRQREVVVEPRSELRVKCRKPPGRPAKSGRSRSTASSRVRRAWYRCPGSGPARGTRCVRGRRTALVRDASPSPRTACADPGRRPSGGPRRVGFGRVPIEASGGHAVSVDIQSPQRRPQRGGIRGDHRLVQLRLEALDGLHRA